MHVVRERVRYAEWTQDAEGKTFPRLIVEGADGKQEWIDRGET